MNRPRRITAICVIFCLLTLAGFGDSVVLISGELKGVPQWLGFLTLVFGITAGAVTLGLWRMKRWGVGALRAWSGTTVVLFVAAAYLFVEVSLGPNWYYRRGSSYRGLAYRSQSVCFHNRLSHYLTDRCTQKFTREFARNFRLLMALCMIYASRN